MWWGTKFVKTCDGVCYTGGKMMVGVLVVVCNLCCERWENTRRRIFGAKSGRWNDKRLDCLNTELPKYLTTFPFSNHYALYYALLNRDVSTTYYALFNDL